MNKSVSRIAAIVISLSFAAAPALVSAQSVTASTTIGSLQSQIQALLTQLQGLQQQLISLAHASSSLPLMGDCGGEDGAVYAHCRSQTLTGTMGSSTPPMVGGGMNCPMIDRTLSLGSSGSDVSQLQQFLTNLPGNLLPPADVTGFFGPLTQKAVGTFQMQFGISSSSVGDVGPMTRMFFANRCGNMVTVSSTSPAHPIQPPVGPWMGSSTPPRMGTSTQMWVQGTSSQPWWMMQGPNKNPPPQQPQGSGWMGSVPPWQVSASSSIQVTMCDQPNSNC